MQTINIEHLCCPDQSLQKHPKTGEIEYVEQNATLTRLFETSFNWILIYHIWL
jgi:hypothetical protein